MQDKWFRKAKESVQKGKEITEENHYNIKNYRLGNKKLNVPMPGEKKAIFYEKKFDERETIDNKKLEKYVT